MIGFVVEQAGLQHLVVGLKLQVFEQGVAQRARGKTRLRARGRAGVAVRRADEDMLERLPSLPDMLDACCMNEPSEEHLIVRPSIHW
mgnify:CR=1 FL=1